VAKQIEFFRRDVPRIIENMVNRALPRPGSVDSDLLPSTIATKALASVANDIALVENRYVWQPLADAGAAVAKREIEILATPIQNGMYEESTRAPSLRKINDAGRNDRGLRMQHLFDSNKRLLSNYTEFPTLDRKTMQLRSTESSRIASVGQDDERGLLRRDLTIEQAAKNSYFPFYIMDLRPDSQGAYRTVLFKPFNLEISENFAPNWNMQNFMGRVDPVATYQNTVRTISVSFKQIAQHPSDLKDIYNKLRWLSSMVYPEYGVNMRYRSGPVVRLRVGDLINAQSDRIPNTKDRPGVSGIITGLDYNYVPIWEIEDKWQLSRDIDVSFSFVVLHELPVGIIDGEFGTVGMLDNQGVFLSPQEALKQARISINDNTVTREKDYVNPSGFKKFGE
jgi:hypothetical protein